MLQVKHFRIGKEQFLRCRVCKQLHDVGPKDAEFIRGGVCKLLVSGDAEFVRICKDKHIADVSISL